MPILRRRKQTQRGNVCLREGPFSIGSSDSGTWPFPPRDALSQGCSVRGVRAECLGVLCPLCPESGPGGEWRGADRFRQGTARLQERGPLLPPLPLPPALHPVGLQALPRFRPPLDLPNARKLAPPLTHRSRPPSGVSSHSTPCPAEAGRLPVILRPSLAPL